MNGQNQNPLIYKKNETSKYRISIQKYYSERQAAHEFNIQHQHALFISSLFGP